MGKYDYFNYKGHACFYEKMAESKDEKEMLMDLYHAEKLELLKAWGFDVAEAWVDWKKNSVDDHQEPVRDE